MSNSPYTYTTSSAICPSFPGAYLVNSYGKIGSVTSGNASYEKSGSVPVFTSVNTTNGFYFSSFTFYFSSLIVLPGYYCKVYSGSTIMLETDNTNGTDILFNETTTAQPVTGDVSILLKFKGNEINIISKSSTAVTLSPLSFYNKMWICGVWALFSSGAMYPIYHSNSSSTNFYFVDEALNKIANSQGASNLRAFIMLPDFGLNATLKKYDNNYAYISDSNSIINNFNGTTINSVFVDGGAWMTQLVSIQIYYGSNANEITEPA